MEGWTRGTAFRHVGGRGCRSPRQHDGRHSSSCSCSSSHVGATHPLRNEPRLARRLLPPRPYDGGLGLRLPGFRLRIGGNALLLDDVGAAALVLERVQVGVDGGHLLVGGNDRRLAPIPLCRVRSSVGSGLLSNAAALCARGLHLLHAPAQEVRQLRLLTQRHGLALRGARLRLRRVPLVARLHALQQALEGRLVVLGRGLLPPLRHRKLRLPHVVDVAG